MCSSTAQMKCLKSVLKKQQLQPPQHYANALRVSNGHWLGARISYSTHIHWFQRATSESSDISRGVSGLVWWGGGTQNNTGNVTHFLHCVALCRPNTK